MIVQKEVPGFIAIRLEAAIGREALSMVQGGIASPEDIGTVLKTGYPRRWVAAGFFESFETGPGWSLFLTGLKQVLPDIDSSMGVIEFLQERVVKDELGAKTGKGFYHWTQEATEETRQKIAKVFIEIERWLENSA